MKTYTEVQKKRIQSIIRHIWCHSGELFPDFNNIDAFSAHEIRCKIDRGLHEEIDSIYLGDKTLPILDKCLDIIGGLDEYKRVGRPDFGGFQEWYYFWVKE
jgi:hypothetical protein